MMHQIIREKGSRKTEDDIRDLAKLEIIVFKCQDNPLESFR
jgi:hypothetical protein